MRQTTAVSANLRVVRSIALALMASLIGSPPALGQKDWRLEWPHTDFARYSVDLDEIVSGGPSKDGIPAIDRPRFVAAKRASGWLGPEEPVVALEVDGDARAYPIQVLIWHEIVNDTVGGKPVAVTFCPLCNASLTFDRRVDGRVLDFGTSGKLRNSDLVMYDRQTESWWQQLNGEAIVGELTGHRLSQVHSQIVSFDTFRDSFPRGQVLSRDTGHNRRYGENPYQGYDSVEDVPFLTRSEDARLPPKERILAVRQGEQTRLYPFSALKQQPVINDRLNEVPIAVFSEPGTRSALDRARIAESRLIRSATAFERTIRGLTLEFEYLDGAIYDRQTGSRWNLLGQAIEGPLAGETLRRAVGTISFAFAWLAFDPEAEIYEIRSSPTFQ